MSTQRTLLPRRTVQQDFAASSSQNDDNKREDSPTSSTTSRKRGPLVTAACNSCRKRKVKCDGKKPFCSNCHKRSIPCTYDETSKSERLRVVQERLKEAHDEIDSLRKHIQTLTNDMQDPVKRNSLAQAGGEIDRIESMVNEIGNEIPGKLAQTTTQHLLGDGLVDGISPAFPAPTGMDGSQLTLPAQTKSLLSGNIIVILPAPSTQTEMQNPLDQFGNLPFDPAASFQGMLRIYQEDTATNLYTHLHQMVPLNNIVNDAISKPCLLQYLRCRQCLAEGMSIEDVLGSEILDLACVIAPESLTFVHPFTDWVVAYVDAFSGPNGLDWAFRIASIYCMFHLLRWLVSPTSENYARVPDFMRPTPMQLFITHPFWINFVILPGTRNEFVLRPHANQLRQWTQVFLNARINWQSTDMASAIVLDSATNSFQMTPEFEATIRKIDNWYLPY